MLFRSQHFARKNKHDGFQRTTVTSLGVLASMFPTPTTQDANNNAGPSQRKRNSDPLNVTAARISIGETTVRPSQDGNLLPDPHPDQLTIEGDSTPALANGSWGSQVDGLKCPE